MSSTSVEESGRFVRDWAETVARVAIMPTKTARNAVDRRMPGFYRFAAALAVTLIGAMAWLHADDWAPPRKVTYYSANRQFGLEVTPAKNGRARGAFLERRAAAAYSKTLEFKLLNKVSPVRALVADSGRYLVTFDNWAAVGYGDNVVVIYRANGMVVRKFALRELLTDNDMKRLPRTVSSIWWGGKHSLDEAAGTLVLEIVADSLARTGSRPQVTRHLRIDLATGEPLEPKRDLFAN